MKTIRLILVTAALGNIFLFGCRKPGPPGKDGKDGKDGNANVITSNTVALNWTSEYDNGKDYLYSSSVTWPTITQSIVDKGVVLVYVLSAPNVWYQLPFSDSGTGYSSTMRFFFTPGAVGLELTGYDATGSPGVSQFNGTIVRITVIPANMVKPNVNYKNYESVRREYNLSE